MANKKRKGCVLKGCGCMAGIIVILGLFFAVVSYLHKPKWDDEFGQRFEDVAYGIRQNNTYDLYLPNDADKRDSLALILYVHGGSWMGGDKGWHHRDCYKWVQKGYVTATMNYSLLGEEETSLLTMLDEIEQCISHIVSFTSDHGVQIKQMAIAGTSAGGHLAMMYAYQRSYQLPLKFEAIKVGPVDFRILFPFEEGAPTKDMESFVYSCTGKHMKTDGLSREQLDSIKLQASPIAYINDSTALPAIFAYGGKDNLVKPAHYRALKAKYEGLGKKFDLIVFPNSGHNLDHNQECTILYDSIMSAYSKQYFGY